jgi:hypothetical protein
MRRAEPLAPLKIEERMPTMIHRTGRTLIVLAVYGWVAAWSLAAERVDYRGHQVVRVRVDTAADLERIRAAGGEVLNCCPRPGTIEVRVSPGKLPALAATGLPYKLLAHDLGPATTRHLARARGTGPFDDYMPLADIETFIEGLAAQRPDLCSVTTIGFSLENRPIKVLHVTGPTGTNKPGVFYHGLQHAREWITGPMVLYIANHLVTQYDTDPCVRDLVDRGNIYLAPCVNPDGYTYSWTNDRLWRKNRRHNGGGIYGVDLNRNWGFGWGGPGASTSPSDPTYRGPNAFSEPETQVLSGFMAAHPEIRAYMDYHSYSQLILWPFGYTSSEPPEPDRTTFYTLGERMQALIQAVHGQYYEPGPINTTIYPASGGSVDWAYGDQGIFGFTIELRPVSFIPGFELPPDEIIPTCEENLPAILHLTEWALNDVRIAPTGPPLERITAGSATTVNVDVTAYGGTVVPGSVTLHYRYAAGDGFTAVAMASTGRDTHTAKLPATNCTSTPQVYFTAQSSTGQTVYYPCGAPANTLDLLVTGGDAEFYYEPFDVNPNWTTEGLWAWGQPAGGGGQYGNPDPSTAYSGDYVYGYNLAGDYENSLPERHLTSTPIDCTGRTGVTLSFQRWLGVETSTYDHASISVSNDGTNFSTIWQNSGEISDVAWTAQSFDISAYADDQPTVYLRWTMGTTDSAWRYCGWNIDDVRLTSIDCDATPGDWNGDSLIDADDFLAFPPCVLGPFGGLGPGCGIFDGNSDSRIDLRDFAIFQRAAD